MASLLRQIVAGPRLQHADTGLDLCYVTEDIIVTSGPSHSYPKMAYRTPVADLVAYLDATHGSSWAVWEFRAEGTGYPDSAVHGRILHFPFPDHHPPPFQLVPGILASMRNWLAGGELEGGGVAGVRREGDAGEGPGEQASGKEGKQGNGRVVVVHCKAGKGRSGTMTTAFLIAERAWSAPDALSRFTERRMRPGFGQGVSIPSQRRWVAYVDRWARHGKRYADRRVQVVEVHAWGVRDGVRIEVEGFLDGGRRIQTFHRFTHGERTVVDGGGGSGESESEAASASSVSSTASRARKAKETLRSTILFSQALGRMAIQSASSPKPPSPAPSAPSQLDRDYEDASPPSPPATGQAIILRPSSEVTLPTSDVKISVQRRSRPRQLAPSIVTSVAHVWFNAFFEGKGPELGGRAEDSGVFEVGWDEMDGLKGFARVGTRAFDRIAVVWRAVGDEKVMAQPGLGEDVGGVPAADWRGEEDVEGGIEAEVDEEMAADENVDVGAEVDEGERAGLKSSGPSGGDVERAGGTSDVAAPAVGSGSENGKGKS